MKPCLKHRLTQERRLMRGNLASDTQSARTEPESRLKCFLGIASIPLFTTGCPIIEVNHLTIKYLQYFVMFWSFWTGFYRIYDFIDFAIHKLDSNHILYSIYLYSRLGMIIGPTLLFVFKKYRILAFADGLFLNFQMKHGRGLSGQPLLPFLYLSASEH